MVKQRTLITKKIIHHIHPNARMEGARLTYYDSHILCAVDGVTNRKGIGNIASTEIAVVDILR